MKFSDLAKYLDKLERTSSRINITKILAELFKTCGEDEIDIVVYLILGSLAPPYRNIVFNVADRMMFQVIAKAYGVKQKAVVEKYKKLGDLGDVAFAIAQNKKLKIKDQNINVEGIYNSLLKVAEDKGEGTVVRKIDGLANLLKSLDPLSARFISRIPVGKLRLGFSDKTIIDALSWMETGSKIKSKQLEGAYFILPDVGALAKAVKKEGIDNSVKNVKPEVGVPLLPMLGQRLKSPKEMIEKMGEVSVEPKFDGLRIQIHYKSGQKGFVKVFTRNMNETTWMFPELLNLGKYLKAKEVVLDSEAMGVDEKTKMLANFQQTMTRRRKHNIDEVKKSVGIKFYIFDILLKDGKNLMGTEYRNRRTILENTINNGNLIKIIDHQITKNPATINKLMKKNKSQGLEGIFVKRLDSKYVAGRTGWRWVKMKEAEDKHAKLADTVDCVVMGYSRGKGKRAGFGVGQFLAGIIASEDKKSKIKNQNFRAGKIYTITKVGTGITDERFKELAVRLQRLEVGKEPKRYVVHKDLEPDYWVKPNLIVELAADEITKSPKHS